MRVPSGSTDRYIYFVAVDSTDYVTRETGLSSFTVYRSRNGGAAAAFTTPTVNEVDSSNMPGLYELLLDEDTTIGAGSDTEELALHITHAGMHPVTRTVELYRPETTAGQTLTVSSGTGNAAVQSIVANAITATSIATDAITADKVASDAIAEIQSGLSVFDSTTDQVIVATNNDKTGYSISGTLTTLDALDTAQDSQHSTTQSAISGLNNLSTSDIDARLAAYNVVATTDLPTNFEDLSITATTGLVSLAADQSGVTIGTVTTNTDMRGTDSALLATAAPSNWSSLVISAGGAVDSLLQGFLNNTIAETTANNIATNFEVFFDNANGITTNTLDDVGAGGGTDWDSTERAQIRYRLGIDGTESTPSTNTDQNLTVDLGSVAGTTVDNIGDFAEAVRTELQPELFQISQMEQYHRGFAQISDAGLDRIIDLESTVVTAGEIRAKVIFKQTGANQAIFGVREASVERFTLFTNTTDGLRFNYRGTGNAIVGPDLKDGREYDIHLIWSGTSAAMYVNKIRYNDIGTVSGNLPTVNTLHLGGRKTDSTTDLAWSGIIKEFEMRDANTNLLLNGVAKSRPDWQHVGQSIDLWLGLGQSNWVGRADDPSSNTPLPGTAFDFGWGDFSSRSLADPVGYSPNNATVGSAVPNFAKTYHALTGRKVLYVGAASGASEVVAASPQPASNSWDDSGDLYDLAVAKAYKALNYYRLLGYRVVFKGILWSQGETDAQAITSGTITKADYKAATLNVFEKLRTEFGENIGVIISQTGTKTTVDDAPGFVDVRAAQQELVDENEFIFMGFDGAVNFPAEGKMSDEVHYTIEGYDEMGASMATVAAAARIGEVYSPSNTNQSVEQMLAMAKDTQMDISVLPNAEEVNAQAEAGAASAIAAADLPSTAEVEAAIAGIEVVNRNITVEDQSITVE